MKRFVDTNIFVYALTAHPKFGKASRNILERIEAEEKAITSTLVLCEIAWVLEAMGKQNEIKPTLEKILSYKNLEILNFNENDLIVGASNALIYHIDFNDGVNIAIMEKKGVNEVYSNDKKHLGKVNFLKLVFE
ncbi:MAG: type II toxin-antitoxin system VapC family toxin [Thermoproteota archaeon]